MGKPKKALVLPSVAGCVRVSFKHEDEIRGQAIGPVIVIEVETFDAWVKANGKPFTNGRGEIRYAYPYGSKPDGQHDLGWQTLHAARKVAEHYGVTLEVG